MAVWFFSLCLYIYIYVWLKIPMYTTLIMKFILVTPLTSANLYTTNYGTLCNTMIQRESLLEPSISLAAGPALHNIMVMPLPTVSIHRTKISWPSPPYNQLIILSQWIIAGALLFTMRGGKGGINLIQALYCQYTYQGRRYLYQWSRHNSVLWTSICWSIGNTRIYLCVWAWLNQWSKGVPGR